MVPGRPDTGRRFGMSTTPPVTDQLGRAVAATADLVAGIGDQQWVLPTCCPDLNVRVVRQIRPT